MEKWEKRKRGRPQGSKDKQKRVYRSHRPIDSDRPLSVEEQVYRMRSPGRISEYVMISGLSASFLRSKIENGQIVAFRRSAVVLIEPVDFLRYWFRGKFTPKFWLDRLDELGLGAADELKYEQWRDEQERE